MNAGEMVPLFVGLLTARRWDQVTQRTPTHLRLTGSTAEREELQVWRQTAAVVAECVVVQRLCVFWRGPGSMQWISRSVSCGGLVCIEYPAG